MQPLPARNVAALQAVAIQRAEKLGRACGGEAVLIPRIVVRRRAAVVPRRLQRAHTAGRKKADKTVVLPALGVRT